ncbi:hypothetical protein SDC9_94790 [bioreactor metagenome]|uniref:N-acetyltransferase domain-containing protein n=1 Tax=bioreactor metagenome TaxID=1076179 RepID=A0A645A5U0_9ZZZZ
MRIVKVKDKTFADKCDNMLTDLIIDERKYDKNVSNDLVVHDWYCTTLDDNKRATFVAIEEENVLGFIHGYIKEEAGTTVNDTVVVLDALYVKENNRNKGIGTSLIDEFKKWSKSLEAKYIDLSVLINNNSAIELYKKHGFKPLKSYMRAEF